MDCFLRRHQHGLGQHGLSFSVDFFIFEKASVDLLSDSSIYCAKEKKATSGFFDFSSQVNFFF